MFCFKLLVYNMAADAITIEVFVFYSLFDSRNGWMNVSGFIGGWMKKLLLNYP